MNPHFTIMIWILLLCTTITYIYLFSTATRRGHQHRRIGPPAQQCEQEGLKILCNTLSDGISGFNTFYPPARRQRHLNDFNNLSHICTWYPMHTRSTWSWHLPLFNATLVMIIICMEMYCFLWKLCDNNSSFASTLSWQNSTLNNPPPSSREVCS